MMGKKEKGFSKKLLSFVLVFAMAITMVQSLAGWSIAKADDQMVTSYESQTIVVHYFTEEWDTVNAFINTGDWNAVSGYNYAGSWPGAQVLADKENEGWYSFAITTAPGQINCILNNGNGSQTDTMYLNPNQEKAEYWVSGYNMDDLASKMVAPENWVICDAEAPVNPNANSKVVSPVVNEDHTVTFNLDATGTYKDAESVVLRGTIPETDWSVGKTMELVGDVYTYTTPVMAPGVYQYKFVVNGSNWITDPMNDQTLGGNSKVVVSGLVNAEMDAERGKTVELPETLTLISEDGSEAAVTPSYEIPADVTGVSVEGNVLTISSASTVTELEVTAKYGDYTSTVLVKITEKVFEYTIYYYDANEAHMTLDDNGVPNAANVYAWEDGGKGLGGIPFTSAETLEDGKVWLKATITSSATKLGVIPRSGDDWSWQTSDHFVSVVTEEGIMDSATIYIVYGDAKNYSEIPTIVEARKRYAMIEYVRENNDYDGWNIYSWNSGFGNSTEIYSEDINGKQYIVVPVKDTNVDFTLEFCMRHTTAENPWEAKDGGDHYLFIPADQDIVVARFEQGKGIVETLPYKTDYEMNGANDTISFYYRNDALLFKNEQQSLTDKVQVVVNGQAYDMSFDATKERFAFDYKGLVSGTYSYYFIVDGKEGEVKELTYEKYSAKLTAKLSKTLITFRDNSLLSLSFTGKDGQKLTSDKIKSAKVDLTALGLNERDINPELMKTSISALNTCKEGTKKLPIKVTDIYGNVYTTSINIVLRSVLLQDNSFEWDEAVIYMTCTDRFFDGNEANDNQDDYDPDNTLGYHGGDFAGLEKKLDYLQSLGVNTIWITPIVENSNVGSEEQISAGYHGYWASNFTELNAHLGNEAEFASLVNALHNRGMKIMVDVVLNHAGYNTEDYFNTILVDEEGNTIPMLRDENNTVSGDNVYDSLAGLPDFVTENEAVRNQLIDWQVEWVNKYGIDYFRVDTVKHVDATTWQAFKNELTLADSKFKMIGEYAGAGYANNAGALNSGSMDSLLDFDFNDKAEQFVTGSITEVEAFMASRNAKINNTATLGAFLSSHDEDGLVQKLQDNDGMTEEEALAAFRVAASLQLTAKGQAVIYYGEEIGLYGEDNYPIQSNRYDFDWEEAARQEKDADSMLNHYKKLLSIRSKYKTLLARGTRKALITDDENGLDVFVRSYNCENLYVALNTKETAQTVKIKVSETKGTQMKDLYSGKIYTVDKNKQITVSVPASTNGGTVILEKYTPVKDTVSSVVKSIGDKIGKLLKGRK